jgi:hypothetical protein
MTKEGNAMLITKAPLVRLPLPNVRNCRDLGGYPTPQGNTRWGRFLRCGDMGQMTLEERDYLYAYGPYWIYEPPKNAKYRLIR